MNNKTREEIIYELLLSLNNGDTAYYSERIEYAILQYNQLVRKGIVSEKGE